MARRKRVAPPVVWMTRKTQRFKFNPARPDKFGMKVAVPHALCPRAPACRLGVAGGSGGSTPHSDGAPPPRADGRECIGPDYQADVDAFQPFEQQHLLLCSVQMTTQVQRVSMFDVEPSQAWESASPY